MMIRIRTTAPPPMYMGAPSVGEYSGELCATFLPA